jgi:dTDP-glucose 4,6-dehydratase
LYIPIHAGAPTQDLAEIAINCKNFVKSYKRKRILIVGGSGFIGEWLSLTFLYLDKIYDLGLEITIVYKKNRPNFGPITKHEQVILKILTSDEFLNISNSESYDFIFHCATPTRSNAPDQSDRTSEILDLTTRIIQSSRLHGNVPRLVHLSSGAVYGTKSRESNSPISGTLQIAKIQDLDGYGRIKVKIEELVDAASLNKIILGLNIRLFTFYGPGLEITKPFAITEFINASLQKLPIYVAGSPDSTRTYMYPTDLISNLLFISQQNRCGAVLLGGTRKIRMEELANLVAKVWGNKVFFNSKPTKPNFYFPEVELDFESVDLEEGLFRWKSWLA